jgi:hypothetical protein
MGRTAYPTRRCSWSRMSTPRSSASPSGSSSVPSMGVAVRGLERYEPAAAVEPAVIRAAAAMASVLPFETRVATSAWASSGRRGCRRAAARARGYGERGVPRLVTTRGCRPAWAVGRGGQTARYKKGRPRRGRPSVIATGPVICRAGSADCRCHSRRDTADRQDLARRLARSARMPRTHKAQREAQAPSSPSSSHLP